MDKIVILDGDFQAELHRHLKPALQKEEQAITLKALVIDKEAVIQTHLAYLRAGAQIIRTNTYRVSLSSVRENLKISQSYGLPIISQAVELAKQAVKMYCDEMPGSSKAESRLPLIAGSCGSYNASKFHNIPDIIKSTKYLLPSFFSWFHKLRVDKFLEAGVDMLSFESIPSWKEMEAIIEILKEHSTTRILVTFLCTDDAKLIDETSFVTAAKRCYDALPGLVAVGAECESPEVIEFILKKFKEDSNISCVYYVPKNNFPDIEEKFITLLKFSFLHEWFHLGLRYIGGSTYTTAEDIKEIRKQVEYYLGKSTNKSLTLVTACSRIIKGNGNKDNQSKL